MSLIAATFFEVLETSFSTDPSSNLFSAGPPLCFSLKISFGSRQGVIPEVVARGKDPRSFGAGQNITEGN